MNTLLPESYKFIFEECPRGGGAAVVYEKEYELDKEKEVRRNARNCRALGITYHVQRVSRMDDGGIAHVQDVTNAFPGDEVQG